MSARPDPEVASATSGRRSARSPGRLALRIAVFVPVTLLTALAAHSVGDGRLLPAAAMLGPTALALLGATALLVAAHLIGARTGWGAVGAVTAAAQVAVHLAGTAAAPRGGTVAGACCSPAAHHHPGMPGMEMPGMAMSPMPGMEMPGMAGAAAEGVAAPLPTAGGAGGAGMAMPTHDLRMLAAHVLAAAVTALLLRSGERMLLAVLRAVAPHLPSAPAGVLPAPLALLAGRAPQSPTLTRVRPGGVGRRGPPIRALTRLHTTAAPA